MMPARERRSEQEQIDSLLNEASDEVAINARREADYIRDLEIRLTRLKGIGATGMLINSGLMSLVCL